MAWIFERSSLHLTNNLKVDYDKNTKKNLKNLKIDTDGLI
jgi:hypothetical protein